MIQESVWESFEECAKKYSGTRIHLVGHSIGTGVISYLYWRNKQLGRAAHPIQGILFFSYYESILRTRLDVSWLFWVLRPFDVFQSWWYLSKSFDGYLYLVYSEKDEIIPSSHSKRLNSKFGGKLTTYEGKHSDLTHETKMYHLIRFMKRCKKWHTRQTKMKDIPLEINMKITPYEAQYNTVNIGEYQPKIKDLN